MARFVNNLVEIGLIYQDCSCYSHPSKHGHQGTVLVYPSYIILNNLLVRFENHLAQLVLLQSSTTIVQIILIC